MGDWWMFVLLGGCSSGYLQSSTVSLNVLPSSTAAFANLIRSLIDDDKT